MKKLVELFSAGGPVSLTTELFAGRLRVLNLAPHPDDFDVAGITFKRMQEAGCRIHVSVLSSGASGVEDAYCKTPDWEAKASTREREQRRSCEVFGLDPKHLEFARLPEADDGELVVDEQAATYIAGLCKKIDPQIIVIPHGLDSNPGHRRTYKLVREYLATLHHPVLLFCCLDPKTLEIKPNAFSWFGMDAAEWKRGLLLCHHSQQQRNLNLRNRGFDERILDLNAATAKKYGGQAGYAEAFEVKIANHG